MSTKDKKDSKAKEIYKIRRKSDGLFSSGGSCPQFTKKGKNWSGLGPIKLHMHQLLDIYGKIRDREVYKDCEVIKYEMVEIESDYRQSVDSFMDEILFGIKKKEEAYKAAAKKREEKRERAELERLKKKYKKV